MPFLRTGALTRRVKALTVKDSMEKAAHILKENKIESPVKEAGVLLAYVLKKDVSWLYAHPEHCPGHDELTEFDALVNKRSKRMPLQYITNSQEFMSLNFYVNRHCLVPRPETEILVGEALKWIKNCCRDRVRVLDIGAGSGAICVSIAWYSGKTIIDALDISKRALLVAEINAKKYHVDNRIKFINADFTQWENEEIYNIIVSNPPYIPRKEIETLMPEVRDYEPLAALDGGRDGLKFYRSLAPRIKKLMAPGGAAFVEVGMDQAEQVVNIFRENGLNTSVFKDLAGIDRIVRIFF